MWSFIHCDFRLQIMMESLILLDFENEPTFKKDSFFGLKSELMV